MNVAQVRASLGTSDQVSLDESVVQKGRIQGAECR